MTNTPYSNRRKEEALTSQRPHSKCCLNSHSSALTAFTSSLYTQSLGGRQNLCLLIPILIILAVIISSSCSNGEESKSSQAEITELTVTEIPKRATTDVRDSYVIFSISAEEAVTDYHLAVVESTKTAPTAAEMASGALKRNLGTEPINVLIAQRLNAPMVTFAKEFFADNTYQTLGTGMIKNWDNTNNFAIILDDQASGSDAWVAQSVLEPSTGYTLYGMHQDGSTVTELLTLNTDADASSATASADDTIEYVDTTLEKEHIEIAMHADEYYIVPLQVGYTPATTTVALINVFYSGKVSGDNTLRIATLDFDIGGGAPGYDGQLLLAAQKGTEIKTGNTGTYVLMQTAAIASLSSRPNDIYFGQSYTLLDGSTTETLLLSHLKIQE